MSNAAMTQVKEVHWVGRSIEEVRDLPKEARREMGFQLYSVQRGGTPASSKSMGNSIGNGVRELCVNTNRSWFRLLYTTVGDTIVVLHVFQKKTNQTPKAAIEVALKRLKGM